MNRAHLRTGGFTLVELLTALLILSILALTSYRGLGAVLDARARVTAETEKWRDVTAFFARFERDIQLAIPRSVRFAPGEAPAWVGRPGNSPELRLEFSRSAPIGGGDVVRRTGYRLNEDGEIELWLWPGLDRAPGFEAARHAVLRDVRSLDFEYLGANAEWVATWPIAQLDPPIPRALRLRMVLGSGEELVRVFLLKP